MSPVQVQNKAQLIALRAKLTRFQLRENKQKTVNIYNHLRVRVHQIAFCILRTHVILDKFKRSSIILNCIRWVSSALRKVVPSEYVLRLQTRHCSKRWASRDQSWLIHHCWSLLSSHWPDPAKTLSGKFLVVTKVDVVKIHQSGGEDAQHSSPVPFVVVSVRSCNNVAHHQGLHSLFLRTHRTSFSNNSGNNMV